MKIIEKFSELKAVGKSAYSFEYFPPKTDAGLYNLYARLERMARLEPTFIDVTWGAGGSTSQRSFEISQTCQNIFSLDVMMHLTCTGMSRGEIKAVLDRCLENGIENILALRGDPPRGHTEWKPAEDGFAYAKELVQFIRAEYGDAFCIGVAGYPGGHIDAVDPMSCTRHLADKVNAGADFVITQLFYDMDEYRHFLSRCEQVGITCPIIPGILPIPSYERFISFTTHQNIKVPDAVREKVESIRSDDAAVQRYGTELAYEMSQELLELGAVGLHFYTLNLETSVTNVLGKLGFLQECRRELPWRPSTQEERRKAEDVRPIFWSNRPRSYVARTMGWDDFPNGRWGDSRSPTYSASNSYYLFYRGSKEAAIQQRRRKSWGTPETTEDISSVFTAFCKGDISELPWCDSPVQSETGLISKDLVQLNASGYWTINSQPQVNGAPSTDPDVGWGGENGFVYQKAYIEFFTSKERFFKLLEKLHHSQTVTYHAVSSSGESLSNVDSKSVNAVTWGVFPGKEIIQPTVVDPDSFMTWKDEAFALWLDVWGSLYEKESRSNKLLKSIHDEFFLVNIVENDFINGNIFEIFKD